MSPARSPNRLPESDMLRNVPVELRIRNRRYRPWGAVAGLMLLACPMFTLGLMFVCHPLTTETTARFVIVSFLGVGAYGGYVWLLLVDLRRGPRPCFWPTTRAVWKRVVFGGRSGELGPAPGQTIALAALGWVLPRRLWVADLKLAGGIEIPRDIRFPVASVGQVCFAPDPAEDYAELDRPVRFCLATVELTFGKQLRLIVDEFDAAVLRQWAVEKGIAVADRDGYQPWP